MLNPAILITSFFSRKVKGKLVEYQYGYMAKRATMFDEALIAAAERRSHYDLGTRPRGA